jgi:hypothetical protein
MGANTPQRLNGIWVCRDCSAPIRNLVMGVPRRPAVRCDPCGRVRHEFRRSIQGAATAEVGKAVRAGLMKRAAELTCIDCGARAEHYDHRDYTKPLAVEPVCRKCNFARGPAHTWTRETESA